MKGLRPSQFRRLERLSHKRHSEVLADEPILERLAGEVNQLSQSLHMVLDDRGLCRLLWVGPLVQSTKLLESIPYSARNKSNYIRLISCHFNLKGQLIKFDKRDSILALDIKPKFWLCFSSLNNSSGIKSAALFTPDSSQENGWSLIESGDLGRLCSNPLPEIIDKESDSSTFGKHIEKVLLLVVSHSNIKKTDRNLAELEGLVRTAGAKTVAVISQKKSSPDPQTIWGKGKLQEAALNVRRYKASLVIADRELTPGQVRNIERALDCPVMDRSELILDIFAQRASSATGRLQVELAQLRYRLPRLVGRGQYFSRQGGGIGTRGPGETQLEKDRRAISRRIERLLNDLKSIKKHRNLTRDNRSRFPRIAIVGYTNVGKSSLLNSLCKLTINNKVLSEDKLFATLDTTTRRLLLPNQSGPPNELLVTDTVGFIRELPLPLVEAFRATLEETLQADLLLLVVDISNPDWLLQLKTVHELLDSLGSKAIRQLVANKIDRAETKALEAVKSVEPTALYLSATSGSGLKGLKNFLAHHFWTSREFSKSAPICDNNYV